MHLFYAVATTMIFIASAHAQSDLPLNECKRITDPVDRSKAERMKAEFEVRYWVSNSKLSASAIENIDGTDVRINAGLDLETRNLPEARFNWNMTRRNRLRFDYMQMEVSGNTANLAVQLPGGSTIFGRDFDTSASTELEIKQARIGYSWQGINLRDRIRVGPFVEARGFLIDGTILEPTQTGVVERSSEQLGVGMLTVGADLSIIPHPRVVIDSVISGIPVAGLGRLVDVDTVVKVSVQRHIMLLAGYRYLRLGVDSGPNQAELKLHGPVVGVGFRF
jgi:hypothetical protein